jgi:hypothetical protein
MNTIDFKPNAAPDVWVKWFWFYATGLPFRPPKENVG